MPDIMQRYVTLKHKMPTKRDAVERRRDFGEIYLDFTPGEAQRQASRCEQCGVPYCQLFCPLHNNIPDWLKAVAEGRLRDAYDLAQATNNFPEICGRICPQDRLCEAKWACTLEQAGHGTVTIGAVERYITDKAWKEGWVQPRQPRTDKDARVAIVGAGPAGMAAAEELRASGYRVTIFDRHDRMGGLMAYGIPSFKLDPKVVRRRERLLFDAGVSFFGRHDLGRNLSIHRLRKEYDAVLLAFGAYRAHRLAIPGSGLAGVVPALDYLMSSQSRGGDGAHDEPLDAPLDAHGRNVVVIGGGDTAMDCVRTAVRQGARSVTCLYRRDRTNMPGSSREVAHAEEEGVDFSWQLQPEAFMGVPVDLSNAAPRTINGDHHVRAVRAVRTKMQNGGPEARQRPEPIGGSEFEIEADMVVNALGFTVDDVAALTDRLVESSVRGTVGIDTRTMMTNVDGVFASGDAVRGPSLVVWAIRDGRDAAHQIDLYLSRQEPAASEADTSVQVAVS